MEMNGEKSGAVSLGVPALSYTNSRRWLSASLRLNNLRWLLTLTVAAVGLGFHVWEYWAFELGEPILIHDWLELGLFGIVIPGGVWCVLSRAASAGVRERAARDRQAEAYAEAESERRRLQDAYMGILRTLNLAMEARDQYLRGHSDRDADYARRLALHMGLPEEEVRRVETAAQLHDIGKLVVPDSILLKPGPLEPAEWAVMRRHPTVAVEMLRFLDFLAPVLPLIEGDHERWDGGGYPHGLKGEQIPLGARILAVTDAYDAMTSSRPYRPAMSHQRACEILQEGAGTQWDPRVVGAFLQVLR